MRDLSILLLAFAMCGCATLTQVKDKLMSSIPTSGATNAPAVTLPPVIAPEKKPAETLAPVRLAHGPSEVSAPDVPEGGDCIISINGVQFRCFELAKDGKMCDLVQRYGSVRVKDGMMVADDFAHGGAVFAFDHWDLGSANHAKASTNNPVKAVNDTRVRYRCYGPAQ